MSTLTDGSTAPWYRHPWPWFLMLGPVLVLCAGSYTMWLAYSTDDGLVARDYYKRGLLINQTLQRDHNAAALAIAAEGMWNPEGTSLSIRLKGTTTPPRDFSLRIVADKSGIEKVVPVTPIGGDWYVANLARPADQQWREYWKPMNGG